MIYVKDIIRWVKLFIKRLVGRELWIFPQIKCKKMQFGNECARWTFCPSNITENSIVYSFGIGEDISFDLTLISNFKVCIHAFDPTPKAIQWIGRQELPEKFNVNYFGIADYDGIASFAPPEDPNYVSYSCHPNSERSKGIIKAKVYRLKTIMEILNHSRIDILKMDIEGSEYSVIEDIVKSDLDIRQILVEFHHGIHHIHANLQDTKRSINILNESGYLVFSISLSGLEYSLIKESELDQF